jgi:hypothetical protein
LIAAATIQHLVVCATPQGHDQRRMPRPNIHVTTTTSRCRARAGQRAARYFSASMPSQREPLAPIDRGRDKRPRRDAPPTTAAASRPTEAARDEPPPSPAAVTDRSLWPAPAGTQAAPAPHRSGPQAAVSSSPPASHVEYNHLPPSSRSIGWPRSCVWTCRRHAASARRRRSKFLPFTGGAGLSKAIPIIGQSKRPMTGFANAQPAFTLVHEHVFLQHLCLRRGHNHLAYPSYSTPI